MTLQLRYAEPKPSHLPRLTCIGRDVPEGRLAVWKSILDERYDALSRKQTETVDFSSHPISGLPVLWRAVVEEKRDGVRVAAITLTPWQERPEASPAPIAPSDRNDSEAGRDLSAVPWTKEFVGELRRFSLALKCSPEERALLTTPLERLESLGDQAGLALAQILFAGFVRVAREASEASGRQAQAQFYGSTIQFIDEIAGELIERSARDRPQVAGTPRGMAEPTRGGVVRFFELLFESGASREVLAASGVPAAIRGEAGVAGGGAG